MNKQSNQNRKAFSLAEAMIAVVVLGVAASGVILPFTSGASIRAEGCRRTLAAKLAADLTEEIINTPFDSIIAGYDGYSEGQGQVRSVSGSLLTESKYANFSRTATCQAKWAGAAEFILVTVRVYYKGNEVVVINRLISKRNG
ncbi:MAG: type IV pilus modification PilV family protein [Planctomycetota bacterium]|jgi:Tfp pilus assembly protein PilV